MSSISCPACGSADLVEVDPVRVEWFVNGISSYDASWRGRVRVCTSCGLTNFYMRDAAAFAASVGARAVHEA